MTDPSDLEAQEKHARAVAHLLVPFIGSTITVVTDGPPLPRTPPGPVPRPIRGACFALSRVVEAPRELWRGEQGAVVRLDGAWQSKPVSVWITTLAPVAVVRGTAVDAVEYADKGHVVAFPRARNWQTVVDSFQRSPDVAGRLAMLPTDLVRTMLPTDLAGLDPAAPHWFALPLGTKLAGQLPAAVGPAFGTKAEASAAALAARAKRRETHGDVPGPSFVQCRSKFVPATGIEVWEPREVAEKTTGPSPETPAPPKEPKAKTRRAKKTDAAGA